MSDFINFKNLVFSIEDDKISLKKLFGMTLNGGNFAEVQVSGENKNSHAGIKMIHSSEGAKLRYVSHDVAGDTLKIVQRSDLIEVGTFFTRYDDTDTVAVYNEIKNVSERDIVLEEASSFVLNGFSENGLKDSDDLYFTRFLQSHQAECQPYRASFTEAGLFYGNLEGQKRIAFANVGSWSTKEELPQGVIENVATKDFLMFQIESNNSWYYEISDDLGKVYLYLGGANLTFGGWSKKLKPSETYQTKTAALSYGKSLNGVIAEITKYRRRIAGRCAADDDLPAIFNEYMHLSWDSPTEENTANIAPVVAKTGVKYYVIDCGWHNEEDGNIIYPYVGQWKESKARFPHGLKKTTDFLRSLGLKAGLWIEPEVIGIKCEEMLNFYDDGCFLQRNGKKVAVMNRCFLDFRAKKVVDYLTETIRRMVEDYGADYIKLDYNQDVGVGTDYASFCAGEGLEECGKAYLRWIESIRAKFPQVLFETCSSGGMRMDYETLRRFSIISTSDQTDYNKYPFIAGNILSAVLPEQAAVWSYPVDSYGTPDCAFEPNKEWVETHISEEQVVTNMINSFLGRMHLASRIHLLSDKKFALVKEGVEYYNKLSEIKKTVLPYFPCAFTRFGAKTVSCGLKSANTVYLAVWNFDAAKTVNLRLDGKILSARIAYPMNADTEYSFTDDVLSINFTGRQARFFEIRLNRG